MNHDFRNTPSVLALSLSDKTENYGRYATTYPPASRSMKARLLACIVSIVCVLVLGSLSTPRLAAQIATGGVTGTVKDASGAVVPDAVVTLTNTQTSVVQSTQSTSTGTYGFTAVPVGTYTMKAAHPGFQDVVINGIDVHIQVVLTEDATLSVGSAAQQVTVTAAAPLLQAESATIGTTIGSQAINDLPLSSRHFDTLAQTVAGATTASTQFSGAPGSDYYSIDGMNPWMQDFRLDGIDDNVELYGGAGPTNTNLSVTPPPDAIQEFRLQNGDFPAEFGHSCGSSFATTHLMPTTILQSKRANRYRNSATTSLAAPSAVRFGFRSYTTAETKLSFSLIIRAHGPLDPAPTPITCRRPCSKAATSRIFRT
jgi:hypothetical protein